MILEPNKNFSAPFPADTSGLILRAGGPDFKTISIAHVVANTPAAKAGLQVGDNLVLINDQEPAMLGVEGLRNLLTKPGGYHLQLRRGQQNLEVDMITEKALY